MMMPWLISQLMNFFNVEPKVLIAFSYLLKAISYPMRTSFEKILSNNRVDASLSRTCFPLYVHWIGSSYRTFMGEAVKGVSGRCQM